MTWSDMKWESDGLNVVVTLDADGTVFPFRVLSEEMARLVAAAPELRDALKEVTGWLTGSDVYAESHGAHTAAVEAGKLLDRIEGTE